MSSLHGGSLNIMLTVPSSCKYYQILVGGTAVHEQVQSRKSYRIEDMKVKILSTIFLQGWILKIFSPHKLGICLRIPNYFLLGFIRRNRENKWFKGKWTNFWFLVWNKWKLVFSCLTSHFFLSRSIEIISSSKVCVIL